MVSWYTATGAPADNSQGSSATIRGEYTAIETAFGKLPTTPGDGVLKINAGNTAIEAVATLAVAQGGTGAATLTDGGILLGSGTGAVTATAQPADGEVLVGTGAGDPVLESGATLRTSIGLGTGDSPTFAGLTLSSPLAVGQGGTGVTTLTDGGVLLGSGAGAITPMARLTDGQMIVGQAAGDPVAESGGTLRTSIGVGTGDSPTFAGLTLSSPLAVASGGIGAATLTDGGILVGSGTGAITALSVLAKGSILTSTGSGDPTALAVGTDTHVLTADSAEATGLKWAAVGGGGGVGTMTTVKEGGVQVGGADIAVLDFDGDDFNISESPDTEINISIPDASATVLGLVELATSAEVNAGSDTVRAVVPSTLAAWTGSSNIATVGTISSGEWQGNAVAVSFGGTGASSLTDGGVLLGSGTAAVTAMARLTNLEMIVGQAAGDPVAQSGATLRTSLGLGTTDAVSFASMTLTTDLAVAHGGTGASSHTDGAVLLGAGSSAITNTGVLAKGIILVGDGVGAPTQLAVGADNQVLTADAAEVSGVKWAGGAAGTLNTIQSAGVQVGGADITTLDFGAEFTLAEAPDTDIDVSIRAASTSQTGIVELATIAETNAGSSSTLAVTPAALAGFTGSSSITTLGTITSGTWQGTTIAVTQGGTGQTSLQDGGILLGSGTGAITATARPTDGQILVGQAAGDPVLESGTTARASLGVHGTHTGGDVTGDENLTIANDAVTYAKMQNVTSDNRILGNNSGAGGIITELTPSDVRTMINVANGATANAGTVTSVSGGTGLTGTVTSSGSLNLDISGLTAMTTTPVGTDSFLYNDGGTMKQMSYNQMALPSTNDSNAHTFASTDVGEVRYYTGAGGHTWTMPSGVGQDECFIIVVNSGTGNLTLAGSGVTLNTAAPSLVLVQGGIAVLIRESSTVWFVGGTGLDG